MTQPEQCDDRRVDRRWFLSRAGAAGFGGGLGGSIARAAEPAGAAEPTGLVEFLRRSAGGWSLAAYAKWLGAANAFKEGDELAGLAADERVPREQARRLLAATTLREIDAHPVFRDSLQAAITGAIEPGVAARLAPMTLGELKAFLLTRDGSAIKAIMPGLSSEVIGCVVKILSDAELIAVSAKIFNPLPGSNIGARGYLGARIQPNSPTDHPDDIVWQVFNGFAYGVGDVVLGTNPVSSEPESVRTIELALKDIVETFGLAGVLPHCVLAHINCQAEVEARWPGSTGLWFQSIAGSDAANRTFDVTLERLQAIADSRTSRFGLYFETGQGADFTNGHAQGMDMVLHESRKYGLARHLSRRLAVATGRRPWLHVNDVAGFIGPEVFRNRDQLVRCCLEDLVMGKLHGLCIGLDVCATLHMDLGLDDLDHCLERVAPANPAYLMALPTKIDPMLGYLTTGFQDHLRLRKMFGFRINEPMRELFERLGVVNEAGDPGEHFGDPRRLFIAYRRRKGDTRGEAALLAEAEQKMAEVRARGVFLTEGQGSEPQMVRPDIDRAVRAIDARARRSIWAEYDPGFLPSLAPAMVLRTRAGSRREYILHPATGERLAEESESRLRAWAAEAAGSIDAQIVLSDGLNAVAIMADAQRKPFLEALERNLHARGLRLSPRLIALERGRVRAGYRVGELLFAGADRPRAILHVIGERPGSGHDAFSIYMTVASGDIWAATGTVDHDRTRVVSGISTTTLAPVAAAEEAGRIFAAMWTAPGQPGR